MSDVGPGIRLGNRLSGSSLRPPGRGSVAGRKFLAPPCYSHRAVFASLSALFSSMLCGDYYFRPLFNQRLSSDYFWFGQVGSPNSPKKNLWGLMVRVLTCLMPFLSPIEQDQITDGIMHVACAWNKDSYICAYHALIRLRKKATYSNMSSFFCCFQNCRFLWQRSSGKQVSNVTVSNFVRLHVQLKSRLRTWSRAEQSRRTGII